MQTLKIKYKSDDIDIIKRYIQQYNSVYRVAYNKLNNYEHVSYKILSKLNNIELLDSWFILSALTDAKTLLSINGKGNKIIFGGKKNFINRCKNKISKDEFNKKRYIPLSSIGCKKSCNISYKGNRKFKLSYDLTSVILKLKDKKINLELIGNSKKYTYLLSKIYKHQLLDDTPITYKLTENYIYIIFDESIVLNNQQKYKIINNRILGLDLNPNYIGWSIVDWKSESEFKVIKSGVYSLKNINDIDIDFKKLKLNSSNKKRLYINNKRKYEIIEISKKIIDISIYYKCNLISIEDLSISSKDNEKGKYFNKLVNNQWVRNLFINNLIKRCNIYNIKILKVKPEYSSFIGNFLYRSLKLPDMILSSIEIGRRGYEFYNQYITKTKSKKKNIIYPDYKKYNNLIFKSLEEFKILNTFSNLFEIYSYIKNLN